jgi:serine/threonine protein phosphatase PrpC
VLRVVEHEAFTDTGRQRRHNEDAYFARSPVFAVADGMGGAQAGEVASSAAVEMLARGLPDAPGGPEQRLAEVVQRANERIHEMSRVDEARAGMGTTMTAAHVGETELAVAHVGDSRAYRLRDGEFERLTEDHSLVEEMRRRGQLTAREADEHPQRSIITRALGPEPSVAVDTSSWPVQAGDVYLLCSDGLTSMVDEEPIAEILRGARTLREAGRALIAEANAAGGRDNITVVLFRLAEAEASGAAGAADAAGAAGAAGAAEASGEAAPDRGSVAADDERPTAKHEAVTAVEPAPAPTAVPRAPRAAHPRGQARRAVRRRRRLAGLTITVLLLVPVLLGAFVATQAVYFLGTDPSGFVTLYRGLPYELPFGVELFEPTYVSGVRIDALPPARRERLLDHQLRSKEDASTIVRELERNQAWAVPGR